MSEKARKHQLIFIFSSSSYTFFHDSQLITFQLKMEAVELDYSDTTADVSSSLKAPSPPLPVLPTLTLEYGILKMIFGYLNIRDLLTCLKVSKHWNEVGTIVRRQRLNKPELLLYHLFPIERTREVVELSNDLELSDSTVTWANDPGTQSRQAELEGSGSRTRILQSELEPRFWSAVVSQFSEPSRIICVGTSNLIPYLTLGRESRGYLFTICDAWLNFQNYSPKCFVLGEGSEEHETSVSSSGRKIDLFRRLGKIAPCIGLIGYGIVLTLPDNSACFENEQQPAGHRVFLPMITGIVIPKIQGLKVSMFSLTARQRMEKVCDFVTYRILHAFSFIINIILIHQVSADNCEKILNIQPEDKVKGIVLFQSFQKIGRENHLLSAICEYLK